MYSKRRVRATRIHEVVRRIKRTILSLLLVSALIGSNSSNPHLTENQNCLENPSFEEVSGWKIVTADRNDVADPRNSRQAHTGQYSAYTKATTIGGDGYAFVYQNLSVPVSSSLELSFWLYVKSPELPLHGYIKGFVATSKGRFFDVGIWSDPAKPKPNEYRYQARLEKHDEWFRINVELGKCWINEAKFPIDDTINTISFGIYNGLVYDLPKNLLQLEVFFDDVFLGPSTLKSQPQFPWLLTISSLVSIAMVALAILAARHRSAKTHLKGHDQSSAHTAARI